MVRGLTKEVEGIIAIVIFVLFIIFYFSTLNLGVFNRIGLYQEIYTKNSIADSIINSLQREGYIVTLNVTIPKYSKDFVCNLSDNKLRYDFCEKFPIFYPLNISYLTDQKGVLNNTDDTLLDPNTGIFFYANFSEFYCEEDNGYLTVKIYNPFNQDLENIYVLIMSPTIYNWLANNYYVRLNYSHKYCYLNTNRYCTNSSNNSIGIVINVNKIKGNSSIYLNVSKSNISNAINIGKMNKDFNLTSLPYKIVYEPLCYKEHNFIISDKVSYNFSKYNDIKCSNTSLNNKYLSFNLVQHNLTHMFFIIIKDSLYINVTKYLFSNMTLTNEFTSSTNKSYYISCTSNSNSLLGEINYIVFSNTSWFIASLEKNINNFVDLLYWDKYGRLHFDEYFYINTYYSFTSQNNISYYNALFRRYICIYTIFGEYYCFPYYGFFFLSSVPIISHYQYEKVSPAYNRSNIYYLPKENESRVIVYFYLTNVTNDSIIRNIYYQFKIPDIKLSRIIKTFYIYPEDLANQNITFSIKSINITYGNLEDKGFSKTYYSYILYNNTLIKDYITIYLK